VKALTGAGAFAWRRGDYGKAMGLCDESVALARELGDRETARALMWRGLVAMRQADFDTATMLFEESLELSRQEKNKGQMGAVLSQMGAMARRRGDYAKATALCEESLAIFRTMGPNRWIAYSLRLKGHAVRLGGDPEGATEMYRESLGLFGQTSDKRTATECIEGLAIILGVKGHFKRALRLLGAAEAAREMFGITMPRPERRDSENFEATAREGLADEMYKAAWSEGRAMTLEQAIEYALASEPDWR
jgi:tetratricopeptide (TPR) repeat protein